MENDKQDGSNKPVDVNDISSLIQLEKNNTSTSKPHSKLSGLAFSGGGIRSASFTLGVAKGLEQSQAFNQIDYLSTVSGGGYTGAALTWATYNNNKNNKQGRSIFDYIRQNADYLIPTEKLNSASLLGVVLRTIFLSLMVYIPLLVCFFGALIIGNFYSPLADVTWLPSAITKMLQGTDVNLLMVIAGLLVLVMAVLALFYSVVTFFNSYFNKSFMPKPYKLRIGLQQIVGLLLTVTVLILFVASMQSLNVLLDNYFNNMGNEGAAIIGLLGGVFSAFRNFQQQLGGKNQDQSRNGGIIAIVAAILMITGLFLSSFIIANAIAYLFCNDNVWIFLCLFVGAILLGYFVNLNNVSLHRMYRDRLMEAFMPNKNNTSMNWAPATQANQTRLSDMSDVTPYHIINTNVVLVDSANAKYRGRGGDNFILSPNICGSDATGHVATTNFAGNSMTLASSMAISGAAVNPHTGAAGQGPTRNKLVSFLMALLNVRLGYWAFNPNMQGKHRKIPNYFFPGCKGLFGVGFSEQRNWIEMTDGGHFENTGVYELIRRRLPLIIMTDGGADPDYHFQDIGNLIEKVRVDFAARVTFREENGVSDLERVVPHNKDELSYPLAKSGYAIADIEYSDSDDTLNKNGVLVVLKPTLIENIPQDIYSYKMSNPSFPQQPTSDQFFDEQQFEAYRELGRNIVLQFMAKEQALLAPFFGDTKLKNS